MKSRTHNLLTIFRICFVFHFYRKTNGASPGRGTAEKTACAVLVLFFRQSLNSGEHCDGRLNRKRSVQLTGRNIGMVLRTPAIFRFAAPRFFLICRRSYFAVRFVNRGFPLREVSLRQLPLRTFALRKLTFRELASLRPHSHAPAQGGAGIAQCRQSLRRGDGSDQAAEVFAFERFRIGKCVVLFAELRTGIDQHCVVVGGSEAGCPELSESTSFPPAFCV